MRIRRIKWASGLALVGLGVTGCAGPSAPLDVGTQTAPLALVLGQLKAADHAPIGPISGPPEPWRRPYYQPPVGVPVDQTPPPAPQLPCPDYDPLSPVLGVQNTVPAPPVKATYPYRASVYESYAGKATLFNADSIWDVSAGPADANTGAYDVTYTVHLGKATTTRVFQVLPRDVTEPSQDLGDQTNPNAVVDQANGVLTGLGAPPLPRSLPNLAAYGLKGIYLKSQTANGVSFVPSVPMAVLQLRQLTGSTDKTAQEASAITSVGVDPTTQAVMAFRSTVTAPANKLNACGTKLESVQVTLTSPNSPATAIPPNPATSLTGPDFGAAFYAAKEASSDPTHPKADIELFDEKMDFGLQYGGLLLHDEVAVMPKAAIPQGLVLDPSTLPTSPPSGAPPTPKPVDPAGSALNAGLWAANPLVIWAAQHGILKMDTFTINEKPKLPKSS